MGFEIYGNVRFNSKDVASAAVTNDARGKQLNIVKLKNGTTISFYDQEKDSKASVTVGRDMGNDQKLGTKFFGIKGLTVEGSEKNDYYYLDNCDSYRVDVEGNGSDDVRILDSDGVFNPKNSVKMDITDSKTVLIAPKIISNSEGWFIPEE